uniref:Uncharacterized protein n=1 Tax=Aureoumbra lagunensis TaxID=44058 RepID=A0A7S3NL69_9STRA|mmetsp:Transcript_21561/g.33067  ORF Transcript_21561/g.33067 Transcript_21561/m.33067 type:complete len:617 (+) Transcript_21561:135-1985(+)
MRNIEENIDEYLEFDPEKRVSIGFPFSLNEVLSINNDKALKENQKQGEAVAAIWMENDRPHCVIIAADETHNKLFGTMTDRVVVDAFQLVSLYETSLVDMDGGVASFCAHLFSQSSNKNYRFEFTRNIILTNDCPSQIRSQSSAYLDSNVSVFYQYQSPRKNGVSIFLFRSIVVDVSALKNTQGGALRYDHYLGSLSCLQAGFGDLERYYELAQVSEDVHDLIAVALDAGSLADISAVEAVAHSFENMSLDTINHNTNNSIRRLLAHSEILVSIEKNNRITSSDDLIQFQTSDNPHVTIPFAIIRSFFCLPVLDLAVLHGISEATFSFDPNSGIIRITCPVIIRVDPLPGTVANKVQGISFAQRILRCNHSLNNCGLDVRWSCVKKKINTPLEEKDVDRCYYDMIATLVGAKALIFPAPTHIVTEESHSNREENNNDTPDLIQSLNPPIQKNSQEKEIIPPVKQTTLILVEDQATLCNMLKLCAEKNFSFTQVQTIITAYDVSQAHKTIISALDTARRVAIVFDENIYTLNNRNERIAYTATELRQLLLSSSVIKSAFDTRRLLFVSYSTSAIPQSPTLHLIRRKTTDTPRSLFTDLVNLIDNSPIITESDDDSRF